MLAVAALDPTLVWILYLISLVFLLLAAFTWAPRPRADGRPTFVSRVQFGWLGFAVFMVVVWWQSLAFATR